MTPSGKPVNFMGTPLKRFQELQAVEELLKSGPAEQPLLDHNDPPNNQDRKPGAHRKNLLLDMDQMTRGLGQRLQAVKMVLNARHPHPVQTSLLQKRQQHLHYTSVGEEEEGRRRGGANSLHYK
jgi:hypothetical protein